MAEDNIYMLHEDDDGQLNLFDEHQESKSEPENKDDAIKQAIEEQLTKIRRQNLLIGAQAACRVILDKIAATQSKPSKITMNDYKRLVKDIENFCRTGISRKVNAEGETEPVNDDETVQN